MQNKILNLCRRLRKCTLDDLVSLTESNEKDIKTTVISLENDGVISEHNGEIIYIGIKPAKKGHIDNKNFNLMSEYRTPEEIDIIEKGFCLEIPPQKLCELLNMHRDNVCKYYGIFRKKIYDIQHKLLKDYYQSDPQIGRYRIFYDKYAYFYVYENKVFVSEKLLKSDKVEKPFTKEEVREFKISYSFLRRIESHNSNEYYMYYRLAEYIWRRNKNYKDLYQDLKQNLLNIYT